MGSLVGKVAAVTGATSGSGRSIAIRFAQEGAAVVLLARAEDRLKALAPELGPDSVGISTDVGDPDSVRAAFDQIRPQRQTAVVGCNRLVEMAHPVQGRPKAVVGLAARRIKQCGTAQPGRRLSEATELV